MGNQQIDAKLLSKMFLAGAANLENNKEWINELNVFPVPDGDTGTNMCMTIMSAANEVSALGEEPEMAALCKAISSGSLRGARGNSGVILSQLLRGFTKGIKEDGEITITNFAAACTKGVETAYKAVMKPKEGTILTVARGIAEKATELFEDGASDLEQFFIDILEHGRYVLSQTPEMLPVLKQAGVVDSGGQGLIEFLSGALDCYQGKEITLNSVSEQAEPEEEVEEVSLSALYSISYEVKLTRTFNIKSEMDFRAYLETIGEEVVVVADENMIKVHIHSNEPGLCIQKAVKYGELTDVKVINRHLEDDDEVVPTAVSNEPRKPFGFIAVSVGEGINEIFRSLGVDHIIEGGQTMNPSTADILDAVEKVNADTIFVLPNNKNIILAANQAAELVTDKNLIVIPTKTIPQGITAVINFNPEGSSDDNEESMMEEIKNVKTGQVTYAVRDTVIDDKEIKKDDFMGIGDSGIEAVGPDLDQVVLELIAALTDEDSELISVYYGSDITEEKAQEIQEKIQEANPDCDVELQMGGQPIYYYVISVE